MQTDAHAGIVADEEARNRRYLAGLSARFDPEGSTGRATSLGVSRSALWTRTGLPRIAAPEVHAIVGRVGLTEPFDAIETDSFYIGSWHHEDEDLKIFSWAAPIAHAFYGTAGYPELEDQVQITRVFRHRVESIVDFHDERVDGSDGDTAFDRKTPLRISAPPRRASDPASPAVPASPPVEPVPALPAAPQEPAPAAPVPATLAASSSASSAPRRTVLRHGAALRAALSAPRQVALSHVLGTLQPDQYRLVTWDSERPLVVQGHPGSGKTIVAAHRAAYLVNPSRPEGALEGRVLLLGPTSNFVQHTRPAVESLVEPGRIEVQSMGDLLQTLLPGLSAGAVLGQENYRDYSDELGVVIDKVAARLRSRQQLSSALPPEVRTQRVYDALRQASAVLSPPEVTEWGQYLSALPEWKKALRQDRLAPLLGHCALSARTTPPAAFDHIIVDEAQDVRPLEWRILTRLNQGGWTLVGDMNQRRSDCCYGSWTLLTDSHGIHDHDGSAEIVEFQAVYRSTAAILAFASNLLPAKQRTGTAIQDGADSPTVARVPAGELVQRVAEAAWQLHQRLTQGTLAIIAVDTIPFRRGLIRCDWAVTRAGGDTWERGDARLRLLTPAEARGLEFDGVIVVEPGAFPQNVGRHGTLYTSLTRANRELMVVHSSPLPDALRKADARKRG